MKLMILGAVLFGSVAAQASDCLTTQSVEDIIFDLQKGRSGMVLACEVRQVLAAEQRHAQLTGSSCGAIAKVVSTEITAIPNGESQDLQMKVTVANEGLGQPTDSYIVTGEMLADGNGDCVVKSAKLAPIGSGLQSPVAQPEPYKQHPAQN